VRAAWRFGVLLQIDKARKQFGGVIAVNDVSLRRAGPRDRGADRPQRRRQEHDLQPDHRRADLTGGTISVLGKRIDNAPPQEVVKLGVSAPSSTSNWCPT
jgi:hypothetical protein